MTPELLEKSLKGFLSISIIIGLFIAAELEERKKNLHPITAPEAARLLALLIMWLLFKSQLQ